MSKKQEVELKATKREESKEKLKVLRKNGQVPAVVYGRKYKSTPIIVDAKEFNKSVLQSEAGRNLIFSLKLGKGETVPVITHDIQWNALTDQIDHLDFLNIAMDEAIKAKVPVEFSGGVPVGVKDSGGVLIHGLREVEVKCLPGEIPAKFVVDVSGLNINESIQVSDLKAVKGVEFVSPLEEMIASVTAASKDEEPTPIAVPETGVVAEGAEGAAPAVPGAKPAAGVAAAPAAVDAKGAAKPGAKPAVAEAKKEVKTEKK